MSEVCEMNVGRVEENGEREREVGRENVEEGGDLEESVEWEGNPNIF